MAERVPPNKRISEFPTVFHMRITVEMKQAIISRGGARWLRSLIEANTRVPENVAPVPAEPDPVKVKGKRRRRVSLDKRKS